MPFTIKKDTICQKSFYEAPTIVRINLVDSDIITESHSDPFMGEWDTE